jgi:hypothetical protein
MSRSVLFAVLAFILLILYVVTVVFMIGVTWQCARNGAADASNCVAQQVNPGLESVVTIVGGLISALIVSLLAVTKPGDSLKNRFVAANAGRTTQVAGDALVTVYLVAWAVVGLAALGIGVMLYPNVYKTLSTIGTTWLGLAVTAGYAYFGIQQT